jgi:hypothetical protein
MIAMTGGHYHLSFEEVNELLGLVGSTHHEITWYAVWLRSCLDTAGVRMGILHALHLWALQADSVRTHLAIDAEGTMSARRAAVLDELERAPDWPPAPSPETARSVASIGPALVATLAAELAGIWGELLAL